MCTNSIAVVIPAHNEGVHLGRVLESIYNAASANAIDEVVVVDNLSTDNTVDVAREHGARVIENQTGSIAKLRNIGARSTTAPILAFIDADILVPTDWLEKTIERFDAGLDGALGFIDRPPDNVGWVGRAWGNRSEAAESDRMTDYLPGRNILISRTAYNAVGGFDEMLTTYEDKDLTLRLRQVGYPVLRSAATVLTHLGSERSLAEFIRKEFWRQSSTLAFTKKHNYTLRTLRNPLLSLWHVGCGTFLIGSTFVQGQALWAGMFWLAPSLILTLRHRRRFLNICDVVQVFLLTLLRWNVAGVALVLQLIDALLLRSSKKKAR